MSAGRERSTHELFSPWVLARMPAGWTARGLSTSLRAQTVTPGGVAERLNAPVLKTGVPSRGPRVRISPPPPFQDFDAARGEIRTREWVRQLCGAKLDTGATATVAPSPRGVSSGPPLRTISPPPPELNRSLPSSSHIEETTAAPRPNRTRPRVRFPHLTIIKNSSVLSQPRR